MTNFPGAVDLTDRIQKVGGHMIEKDLKQEMNRIHRAEISGKAYNSQNLILTGEACFALNHSVSVGYGCFVKGHRGSRGNWSWYLK